MIRGARGALDRHPALVVARALGVDGKLVGIDPAWIEQLKKQLQVTHVLVEADGSRERAVQGSGGV